MNDDLITIQKVLLEAQQIADCGEATWQDYERLKKKLHDAFVFDRDAELADALNF